MRATRRMVMVLRQKDPGSTNRKGRSNLPPSLDPPEKYLHAKKMLKAVLGYYLPIFAYHPLAFIKDWSVT
jgi:hypothetical protein